MDRNGRRVALALTGSVVVIDLETGAQFDPTSADRPYRAYTVDFSPGTRLAVAGSIRFGPSGRVAAGVGEVIQVRFTERGLAVEKQITAPFVVHGCRFVQEGRGLAIWGDRHVQVLPLDVEAMLVDARERMRVGSDGPGGSLRSP